MSGLRVRLQWRDRVELQTLPGPDVVLGRDPSCDLVLDHRSIADQHARLLLRRGRVIIADLGRSPTGVTRGQERLLAPVTLGPGQRVGIGDLQLEAWVPSDEAPAAPGRELESPDPGLRRFAWRGRPGGDTGEWLCLSETHAGSAWWSRVQGLAPLTPLPDGRFAFLEPLPPGLRWSRLVAAVREGRLSLPRETFVVMAVGLVEAWRLLAQDFGAHGLIDPRRLHLGLDGSVHLTVPGPVDHFRDPVQAPYLSPERRYGLPPSLAADSYSVGRVLRELLALGAELPGLEPWHAAMAAEEPELRPGPSPELGETLRQGAHRLGWDPAGHHLARAVRLVDPEPERRFCYVGADRAALRDPGPSD